jgi:hypothetical protein
VTHNAKMVAPQASSSNEYMEMGKPSGEEWQGFEKYFKDCIMTKILEITKLLEINIAPLRNHI